MSQLNKWMLGNKISKLVVVITSKETGENVERWQFDVSDKIMTWQQILKVELGTASFKQFEWKQHSTSRDERECVRGVSTCMKQISAE